MIIIDDKIPFIRGEAERLGPVRYIPGSEISAEDVRDAEALIVRTRTRCDASLLSGSRVKFIATATIGYDHLDTRYLDAAGIGWTNCPGCNADSVAQYVETALLLLDRVGHIDLRQCRIGIVGVGHVGRRVEAMAHRLGLTPLLCDPPRLAAEGEGSPCTATMEDLACEADVITCHTPLTVDGPFPTYHLADEFFFRQVKRRPIFINCGRGEVCDTAALLRALADGQVSEAVIDTWENEPEISRELLRRAFLATPHIAGYSADGKANGTRMALRAVAHSMGRDDLTFSIDPPTLPAGFCYYPEAPDADSLSPALHLYDPRRDSDALKVHPENFEQLRGHYPLRRESWT